MGVVKKMLALAGATALTSTAAAAADFPPPMPPQQYVQAAPVDSSGWYLRGDVGVGSQRFSSFDFTQTNIATGGAFPASFRIDQQNIGDTAFVGFGAGFAWNSWLRVDVTGEFRASSKFKAVASYSEFCGTVRCFDIYDGSHQANVFLANAYIDLGTWWCLTPFIGGGVGFAQHNVTTVSDIGFNNGSAGFGIASTDHTAWNFAWAAHAGVAYSVTNNVKIELAYRYLSMGNAATSEINCGGGGCNVAGGGPRAFYTLTDMTSQDIKLGVRWMLAPEPSPMPLMRRG
jgi:opacity protein-like surface antigen